MLQKLIQEGGNIPILALAYADLCAIHYEWNQLKQAEEYLGRALELSNLSGNKEFQNAGHILRAFVALAKGDAPEAIGAVEQSHALGVEFPPSVQARGAACHVQLALALDDRKMAEEWASRAMENVDAHPFYRFLVQSQRRNSEAWYN
jgi:ATP/maltotriose-dependent transcriptional regulator MalT